MVRKSLKFACGLRVCSFFSRVTSHWGARCTFFKSTHLKNGEFCYIKLKYKVITHNSQKLLSQGMASSWVLWREGEENWRTWCRVQEWNSGDPRGKSEVHYHYTTLDFPNILVSYRPDLTAELMAFSASLNPSADPEIKWAFGCYLMLLQKPLY